MKNCINLMSYDFGSKCCVKYFCSFLLIEESPKYWVYLCIIPFDLSHLDRRKVYLFPLSTENKSMGLLIFQNLLLKLVLLAGDVYRRPPGEERTNRSVA